MLTFHLPPGAALDQLTLTSQRPLCVLAPSLARCASVHISARRAYLGLPLLLPPPGQQPEGGGGGAPWVDVDVLAARWAQVGNRAWGF